MSAVELAGELLTESLRPYFKGKTANARLERAANDALCAIEHLLSVRGDVNKRRKGATVMTPDASMYKRPGSAPRTL